MKAFMDKDFLLSSETSQKLFHEYAENMPIVDYHCHINPQEIAEDRNSRTSHRYGLEEITTNGVRYVLTVWMNITSQVAQATAKNSRNGQRLLRKQSETRCIIGAT